MVPIILLPFAFAVMLLSCTSTAPSPGEPVRLAFACDQGKAFLFDRVTGAGRVTTKSGSYVLPAQDSSIGTRFASDTATLILDEDRAALNGLPGGPFRRCRQVGARDAGPANTSTGDPRAAAAALPADQPQYLVHGGP